MLHTGAPVSARDRDWYRDGRHPGAGGAVAKHARPTAVARYAGLTGSPDESGTAGAFWQRSSSARHDPIGMAISHIPEGGSALAQWFRARTENARGTRKTMIVALARKLLLALWRLVREGVVPHSSFCARRNE